MWCLRLRRLRDEDLRVDGGLVSLLRTSVQRFAPLPVTTQEAQRIYQHTPHETLLRSAQSSYPAAIGGAAAMARKAAQSEVTYVDFVRKRGPLLRDSQHISGAVLCAHLLGSFGGTIAASFQSLKSRNQTFAQTSGIVSTSDTHTVITLLQAPR